MLKLKFNKYPTIPQDLIGLDVEFNYGYNQICEQMVTVALAEKKIVSKYTAIDDYVCFLLAPTSNVKEILLLVD